jgi:hypothetical protein
LVHPDGKGLVSVRSSSKGRFDEEVARYGIDSVQYGFVVDAPFTKRLDEAVPTSSILPSVVIV